MARRRFIRASEIGEYLYCNRAWWLHQIEGVEPDHQERRTHGTALHARHGRRVQLSSILAFVGGALLLAALLLLVR